MKRKGRIKRKQEDDSEIKRKTETKNLKKGKK